MVQVIVSEQQPSSNVAKFGHVGGRFLLRYYNLFQRLQLLFYVLLMMGAMDNRNVYSIFAVNKYLHTVASCWILLIYLLKMSCFNSKFSIMPQNWCKLLIFVFSLWYKNGITDMSQRKSLWYIQTPCFLKYVCAECTDMLLLKSCDALKIESCSCLW